MGSDCVGEGIAGSSFYAEDRAGGADRARPPSSSGRGGAEVRDLNSRWERFDSPAVA